MNTAIKADAVMLLTKLGFEDVPGNTGLVRCRCCKKITSIRTEKPSHVPRCELHRVVTNLIEDISNGT